MFPLIAFFSIQSLLFPLILHSLRACCLPRPLWDRFPYSDVGMHTQMQKHRTHSLTHTHRNGSVSQTQWGTWFSILPPVGLVRSRLWGGFINSIHTGIFTYDSYLLFFPSSPPVPAKPPHSGVEINYLEVN